MAWNNNQKKGGVPMRESPKEKIQKIVVEEKKKEDVEIINSNLELEADEERPGVGYEILSIGKKD